jgi:TonB family protein
VSCSSNNLLRRIEAASPRFIAALAASLALHAALVAVIEVPVEGASSWFKPGTPLHVALSGPVAEDAAPKLAPTSVPAPQGTRSASREGAALREVHYYLTRELDVIPGIMTRVEPQYPESALRRFLAGKVVIRLFIDESGKVERVVTLRADPPGYFEPSAEEAFRAARFSPGMKGGRPVKVQVTLEVNFEHPPAPRL